MSLSDPRRLPGGVAGRRVDASPSRGAQPSALRDGLRGMPQTSLPKDSHKLLRPRGVLNTQGGCPAEHILPLQWVHGGCQRRWKGASQIYIKTQRSELVMPVMPFLFFCSHTIKDLAEGGTIVNVCKDGLYGCK